MRKESIHTIGAQLLETNRPYQIEEKDRGSLGFNVSVFPAAYDAPVDNLMDKSCVPDSSVVPSPERRGSA